MSCKAVNASSAFRDAEMAAFGWTLPLDIGLVLAEYLAGLAAEESLLIDFARMLATEMPSNFYLTGFGV